MIKKTKGFYADEALQYIADEAVDFNEYDAFDDDGEDDDDDDNDEYIYLMSENANVDEEIVDQNDIDEYETLEEELVDREFSEMIDPNEPLYCTCRQGSFGRMVACESEACKIEWFHFECVGLKNEPTDKWYCPDCLANQKENI